MAYTSEIEKLEARYRENPKGRNFAPLADAYRKAGLVDNAIELCQAGLQLHRDYVSGHIVHGRCLVDKKDDSGAEVVFRRVLELDPENILALKVLAEIAERNDHFDAAVEWLDRLLMADPMNGEAADGLTRVRGKAASQAARPAPPPQEPAATTLLEQEGALEVVHEEVDAEAPTVPLAPSSVVSDLALEHLEGPFDAALAEAPTSAMDRPEFVVERASEPAGTPPPPAPPDSGGAIEVFDGSLDFQSAAQPAAPPEGIQFEEPTVADSDARVQVEGLARTQYEGSGLFRLDNEPPREQAVAEDDRPTSPMSDLPLIMPDELLPVPAAPAPPPTPVPIFQLPDDDGAADREALSQAEPVVTETMAELYLRQGHREDALRVYEALSAQRPADRRLRQKVAELSGIRAPALRPSGAGQRAGDFLKGILQARPGAPAPHVPAEPTEPSPADTLSRPPTAPSEEEAAGAGAPTQGSPTRPASDAISLDSVFGDEGGRGSMPVLPEPTPDKPARLPVASGGFSFDDFFGTTAGTGPTGNDNSAARPLRHSGRGRVAEQEEDLDQFQAWLKSLKA